MAWGAELGSIFGKVERAMPLNVEQALEVSLTYVNDVKDVSLTYVNARRMLASIQLSPNTKD